MTLPHKNVQEYSKGKHAGVWNVQKCNYNTPPLQPNQRWLSNPTMSLSCFPIALSMSSIQGRVSIFLACNC